MQTKLLALPFFRLTAGAVSALAVSALFAACGDGSSTPDAQPLPDAPPPVGTISLSWEITDGTSTLSCSDIGATSVRLTAVPNVGGTGDNFVFDCAAGSGTSEPVLARDYDILVRMVGGSGNIGEPIEVDNIVVPTGDYPLGVLRFQISPLGNIEFRVSTADGAPNCAAVADGGAGITAMRFELQDAAGTCIPATFTVEPGAGSQGGTYETTCTGETFGCINDDQVVRVSNARSGGKMLVLTGIREGVDCFRDVAVFGVPAAGGTIDLMEQQIALQPACVQMPMP